MSVILQEVKFIGDRLLSDFTERFSDVNFLSKNAKFLIFAGVTVPVSCYVVRSLWEWYILKIKVGGAVNKVPGPSVDSLRGNLHQNPGPNDEGLEWLVKLTTEHVKMFRLWFGPFRPTIILVHPEPIKDLLKTAEPKYGIQNSGYRMALPWLGRGLLISDGNQWARNRRLLTPAFHFDVLKPYVQIYNESADKLVDNLITKSKRGQSVEIFTPVSLTTLRTVLKCAFSYEDDIQFEGENHPYVQAVCDLAKSVVNRGTKVLLAFDWIYYWTAEGKRYKKLCDYVHKVAEDIITKRRKELEDDPTALQKRYLDFLDILLSARDTEGQGLSPLEIRQEVDTFLFEGHDTTASAISWTLYSLSQHPDIQEKAREEVQQVMSHKGDLDWNDLGKLPYLTQCIKEGMRLHSPVPSVGRELSQDMTIGGIKLPCHTRMGIHIYALHHNPHVWGEDHMEFKPDRFAPENANNMDSHAFLPFSAGPRNCIGQNFAMGEIKTIVAKVLKRFRLEDDKTHKPAKLPEMIMRSKNGIKMYLTPL